MGVVKKRTLIFLRSIHTEIFTTETDVWGWLQNEMRCGGSVGPTRLSIADDRARNWSLLKLLLQDICTFPVKVKQKAAHTGLSSLHLGFQMPTLSVSSL